MGLVTACSLLSRSPCQCTLPLCRGATYFPNRYFRRMVVNFMANHWQLIIKNKYMTLMSQYGIVVEGVADQDRGWTPPLSYKQYLCLLLRRDFWGDEVVLYAIYYMWSMKITVLNTKTLQEYRIHHDRTLDQADIVITYNAHNHFNAAGRFWSMTERSPKWPTVIA